MALRPIGVKTILMVTAALLTVTLTGCGGDDGDAAITARDDQAAALSLDDLDGRTFASVRVDGHQLVDDTRIQIGFAGDDISVNAGCNHLFGTVALNGDRLEVGTMGGTEMGCPDGRNDQDAWISQFLSAGPDVGLDGDTLTLTGSDVVIELVEVQVPEAPTGNPDEPSATSDEGVVVQ
ncbi:META domain-containing protein [Nocardioides antri]|uniref:META domain-containing protein n=1 Tax=Nocardioides antri TaxID=2607659 RepID=A0A5B1M8I7_9ACTN|nr:META domain-containing protein [Nocardioides antri]KAA1429372.1 META domain-containing protein [Nocardioides antri]